MYPSPELGSKGFQPRWISLLESTRWMFDVHHSISVSTSVFRLHLLLEVPPRWGGVNEETRSLFDECIY